MSDNQKRPINEGYSRNIQKGNNKPNSTSNIKPTKAPPTPKPKSN